MIIVSDTSPIINLATVGQLELLHHLYSTISIPHAVYHEVAIRGHEQAGATEVQTWRWFKRHQVRDVALVRHLKLQGYLVAIKSVLDSLITEAGFWIDERLYTLVLESAGEL